MRILIRNTETVPPFPLLPSPPKTPSFWGSYTCNSYLRRQEGDKVAVEEVGELLLQLDQQLTFAAAQQLRQRLRLGLRAQAAEVPEERRFLIDVMIASVQ